MTSPVATAFRDRSAPPGGSRPVANGHAMADVADLWRILWHRKAWLILTTVLFVGAAVLYARLTPPLYAATAQLLVDPRDRQIVSNDVNPNALASDGGIAQVESQVSVLQSNGVLLRAIAENGLLEDEEFTGGGPLAALTDALVGLVGSPAAEPGSPEVVVLSAMRRKLSVKRADKVFVIDVTFTARSPDKAARIANSIVAAYLSDQAEARANAARQASDSLFARLEEQRQRVEAAENAVEAFRTQNNLVEAAGTLVTDQQLTEVNIQLAAAQNRTATLKAQLDQIEQMKALGSLPGSTSEALQNPVIASLRQQESTLAQRDADLSSRLGPRHPSLIAIRTQLEQVRRSIDGELTRVAESVRADYERALAGEAEIASKLERLKTQSLSIDQTSVRLRELQRDLDAVRSVYSSYLVRAQEAREQANVDSTNVRVISEALPPARKSWPRLSILLVGAVGAGIGLGAGLAFLREFAAPSILSPDQAEQAAGTSVVAVMPRTMVADKSSPSSPSGNTYLALPGLHGEPVQGPRFVHFVSGEKADLTRRRIAAKLAGAAALSGERVLLLDADIERASRSALPGLVDVAQGRLTLDDVLRVDSDDRLAVLAVGHAAAGGSDRATRASLHALVAEIAGRFDLVLIDAGRAIRTAPLAAGLAGGAVYLVAETGVSEQTEVRHAARLMEASGRPLDGVLLVTAGS